MTMPRRFLSRSVRRLAALSFALALADACGGGTASTVETGQNSHPIGVQQACVPGQSIACGGPGGCLGFQTCGDDGLHYEPCVCPPAPPPPPPPPPPPEPPMDAGVDAIAEWTSRCQAPDGVSLMWTADADVPAQLAGQWWLCGGAAEFYFPVEFTADGKWYKLTLVDGTFQRNLGPESSGTYRITGIEPGGVEFDMAWTTTGGGDTCCGYPYYGEMQTTPPGKMRLGGGDYLRLP